MQYAKITTPKRSLLIPLKLTNFGKPYEALFEQTDFSGSEVWKAYSNNNFDNPFQKSDEQRYNDMGWWAEILRDKVVDSSGVDDKGKLNVTYVSHAGTEWEKARGVWAPKNGWYVPTSDGMFHEGTLIPFETLEDKEEAQSRMEKAGLPSEQASYFYRLDSYKDDERFVGRGFVPRGVVNGRFGVDAGWLPSGSGCGGVASRPKHDEQDIVMEVNSKSE